MIRAIGTVKKEIRSLGLDTCNPRLTIGVIVRGGTYLDGVVSLPSSRNDASRTLAERFIESEYFPELRAIMQYDPDDQLDSTVEERITKLPTIVMSNDRRNDRRGDQCFQGDLGRDRKSVV